LSSYSKRGFEFWCQIADLDAVEIRKKARRMAAMWAGSASFLCLANLGESNADNGEDRPMELFGPEFQYQHQYVGGSNPEPDL
jgi:hypothetical protein